MKGGQYFKARAYKAGARAVAELSDDIGKLIKQNRLTFVKGIGLTLAKQIEQLYSTGESSMLNELRGQLPAGVVELSRIPGLNVQKVERLQRGTRNFKRRRTCARRVRRGRFVTLKASARRLKLRFSPPLLAPKIASSLFTFITRGGLVKAFLEHLATARGLVKAEAAGETRRWKETVSRIVIVASAKKPEAIVEHFLQFPLVMRKESKSKQSVRLL